MAQESNLEKHADYSKLKRKRSTNQINASSRKRGTIPLPTPTHCLRPLKALRVPSVTELLGLDVARQLKDSRRKLAVEIDVCVIELFATIRSVFPKTRSALSEFVASDSMASSAACLATIRCCFYEMDKPLDTLEVANPAVGEVPLYRLVGMLVRDAETHVYRGMVGEEGNHDPYPMTLEEQEALYGGRLVKDEPYDTSQGLQFQCWKVCRVRRGE